MLKHLRVCVVIILSVGRRAGCLGSNESEKARFALPTLIFLRRIYCMPYNANVPIRTHMLSFGLFFSTWVRARNSSCILRRSGLLNTTAPAQSGGAGQAEMLSPKYVGQRTVGVKSVTIFLGGRHNFCHVVCCICVRSATVHLTPDHIIHIYALRRLSSWPDI